MKDNKKAQVIQGRWHKINKKIKKRITAKYHKIKDWVIDPKGYFLIDIDREKKLLNVGYCKIKKLGNKPVNDMVSIISGKTAIEIVNTLIKENYISSLQHAGDMGIELCKAELALKNNLDYVQDKDLNLKYLSERTGWNKKRPLLNKENNQVIFKKLYAERKDIYKLANHRINCDNQDKKNIAKKIIIFYEKY